MHLSMVMLEAEDMGRAARFWREALGYVVVYEDPHYVLLGHPTERRFAGVGFQRAEGPKREPSRVHVDVSSKDRAADVARLVKLGATVVEDWPYPVEKPTWTVLRDTEGNEFCVVDAASPLLPG